MDVIYKVSPAGGTTFLASDENPSNTRMSISKQNILAFAHSDENSYCVKVVDLEHPWESWIVTKFSDIVDLVL